jgi:hypothetical protein
VERSFQTAQDRLVKETRVAGVCTLEQANRYLIEEFLPWCEAHLRVAPASADDAHRALDPTHDLAAILSHVETRQVTSDYTFQFESKRYQIDRRDILPALRGAPVRVEKRRDGSTAARFQERYLKIEECTVRPKQQPPKSTPQSKASSKLRVRSNWNQNFDLTKAPKIWQAARSSGARSEAVTDVVLFPRRLGRKQD